MNIDPNSIEALNLRVQALALLQRAQALDGMKPFGINHIHERGTVVYLAWNIKTPSENEAISILDGEYNPDRCEYIHIQEGFTLEEMVGLSPTCRIGYGDIEAAATADATPG